MTLQVLKVDDSVLSLFMQVAKHSTPKLMELIIIIIIIILAIHTVFLISKDTLT